MKLGKIIEKIEILAPTAYAECWDNVGLLVGDRDQEISSAVICLDVTEKVYDLCIEKNANLCICHHPFIFNEIRSMDFGDPYYRLLQKLIQANIAIYAAHTNLDVCTGGVNDSLSRKLDFEVVDVFMPSGFQAGSEKTTTPGIGRICKTKKDIDLFNLYKEIVLKLRTTGCHVNFDQNCQAKSILVIGGSYNSDWNNNVVEIGVDTVICGEMKHRDMVFFDRHGIAVFAAGHDATERTVLDDFAKYLGTELKEIKFHVCQAFDYTLISI